MYGTVQRKELTRSAGILLHISSLPSVYGIGDLGPEAYAWVDTLARARQTRWQVLPLGPTGYGDSPYQCFSAFAGNPLLISPDLLVEDGLLKPGDLAEIQHPAISVDFERVMVLKAKAFAWAWENFQARANSGLFSQFEQFRAEQADWLDDFALFMALKEAQGGLSWQQWAGEFRHRQGNFLEKARQKWRDQIGLHQFKQFLFYHQWHRLKEYAHHQGVRFIGDMPIFVALDSADVWAQPGLFQLDPQRRPKVVAGVPPDYFSATGQLWGNPLYDWAVHRQSGYAWWIARLRTTLNLVDFLRLDHFRGFEAAWEIPAGSPTAETGRWVPGPGAELFEAVRAALGSLPLIAEDLGVITPEVDALRIRLGLPGMRILQFAMGGAQENRFLPHNFDSNTVVYTGTHDNDTTLSFIGKLTSNEFRFFRRYVPATEVDPAWDLIRLAWASVANCALAPLQDVLSLGGEARMNVPGQPRGNWRWRFTRDMLTEAVLDRLRDLTEVYQRSGGEW